MIDPRGLTPCMVTGSDGVSRPGECIQVVAAAPRFTFFMWPQFSAIANWASTFEVRERRTPTPAGPPTKRQCTEIRRLLQAESDYGSGGAAGISSNTFGGHRLGGSNNDVGNVYRNLAMPNGDELDVDWFADLVAAREVTGGPTGALYFGGKIINSASKYFLGQPMGYPMPFTDPGELGALSYAQEGRGFSDVFTPEYMESACP